MPCSSACTVYAKWKWDAMVLNPSRAAKRSRFVYRNASSSTSSGWLELASRKTDRDWSVPGGAFAHG